MMQNANGSKSGIQMDPCHDIFRHLKAWHPALHPVGDRDVDPQLQLDVVENKRRTQGVDTFLG